LAMTRTIFKPLTGLLPPTLAWRGVVLAACALTLMGVGIRRGAAQSRMHAAFEDSQAGYSTEVEPTPGSIRLASGQQKPPGTPAKAAVPPAARKSPALKKATAPIVTPEATAPLTTEELPTGPLKAVLPLAGSAPVEGLKLTQDEKDKGLI